MSANSHKRTFIPPYPDKIFVGRIERGFDFLGYHFSRDGLKVAKATTQRYVERAARLYEQEREDRQGSAALGMYVRRWVGWAFGGLGPAGLVRPGVRFGSGAARRPNRPIRSQIG